jgi:hypothetical protein
MTRDFKHFQSHDNRQGSPRGTAITVCFASILTVRSDKIGGFKITQGT